MSNNPFAKLAEVASFQVTSNDISEGLPLPPRHYSSGIEGGQDLSPHLKWSGAPEGTKSFAVTAYDPDAPTGSGLWHWAVIDIPADVTELPTGAGDEQGSGLPQGAMQLPNDVQLKRFIGAAPPAGHGPHRYYFVVHALDVEKIGVGPNATPALLGFTMQSHTLGRAVLMATGETDK
ncbi:YbhB/YbcL family Raf kinase inhibitor-like protein [Cohnella thailandensis]|uniref:YbhB/YbcL family Raf kinase inhibitor-like protein n=1 Tax=Cohnella thailandensis TaxID=557557 RepID=A0A841SLF8_9BACL|nr:YbhB/YbcL family Raf kinase inhibitor-like protein [Cohnella thailandensis]MBP1977325.1 Raf kinase inhibitor-like YbhB/YbcL family protein [Cohnella thailandensis]